MKYVHLCLMVLIVYLSGKILIESQKQHKPVDISVLQAEYDACKKFWGNVMPSMVDDPCYFVMRNPTRYGRPPAEDPEVKKMAWNRTFI